MNDRLAIASKLAKHPAKIVRRFNAHLIREDGTHEPVDAKSIFVDMGGGRDLTIHLYERFKGEGVGVISLYTDDNSGGSIEIKLGAANVCYINAKKM